MNITLYGNGGAGNHGCEALGRSLAGLLEGEQITYASANLEEDRKYGLDGIMHLEPLANAFDLSGLSLWGYRLAQKLKADDRRFFKVIYRDFLEKVKSEGIYASIGGDNYSYASSLWLAMLNDGIRKRGGKTVLLGCSILEHISDKDMIADLSRYSEIITRESLTYKALSDAKCGNNIHLVPDPAFALKADIGNIPSDFNNNVVGINISPMIISQEGKNGMAQENYVALCRYIIDNTDMRIALIPHVVWSSNDDRIAMTDLIDRIGQNDRIMTVEDRNAEQLKGVISKCRFMVAARTHASIAAYSTCVPTLVVGYSVKAKGIATDIFGSYEDYVVPVQQLTSANILLTQFKWLMDNEDKVRNHLEHFMPSYIAHTEEYKKILCR